MNQDSEKEPTEESETQTTQSKTERTIDKSTSQRCIACKKETEVGATKCVHCSTMQNWRRHLQFSSTILSLLVALISVTAIAIPTIRDTFHVPHSEVNAELVKTGSIEIFSTTSGFSNDKRALFEVEYLLPISLLLSNIGDRPGLISSGELILEKHSKVFATGDILFDLEEPIVSPNDYRVENLRVQLLTFDSNLFLSSITYNQGEIFSDQIEILEGKY